MPKTYNAVPVAKGGTFIKNFDSLEDAMIWSKDYADYAQISVNILENRPYVDKYVCTINPRKSENDKMKEGQSQA